MAFDAEVTGTAQDAAGRPITGAEIEVVFDAMWGRNSDAALEDFKKRHGPLAAVTVKGSTKSGADGTFTCAVTVTVGAEGKLPKRNVMRGREAVQISYVSGFVHIKAEGMRSQSRGVLLEENGKHSVGQIQLVDMPGLRGQVLRLSDRAAVADLKLAYSGDATVDNKRQIVTREFTTDKDGRFALVADDLPPRGSLAIKQEGWAFAATSTAWRNIYLNGTVDLGTLIVVPGGGLKATILDTDTRKCIAARVRIMSTVQDARFQMDIQTTDGTVEASGIPEGTYAMEVTPAAGWGALVKDIAIAGGKVFDAGEILCEPLRKLDVIAVDDQGRGIEAYRVVLTHTKGDAPYPMSLRYDLRNPHRVENNLTAERITVDRLFAGTWLLTVNAKGYSPGEVEVTLPATGPVKVALSMAGAISASLMLEDEGKVNSFNLVAVRHDSPHFEAIQKWQSSDRQWPWRTERQPVGVIEREMRWGNERSTLEPVAPGTYLVLLITGQGVARSESVEVRGGETAVVSLTLKQGWIEVAVTENGKPAPGQKVSLGSERLTFGDGKFIEATADVNGIARFEKLRSSVYRLLGPRERAFVEAAKPGTYWDESTLNLFSTQCRVEYGTELKIKLELADPERIWPVVRLKVTDAAMPLYANLRPADPQSRTRATGTPVSNTNEFRFLPLPAGKYVFEVQFSQGNFRDPDARALTRELELRTAPEQTFDFEFDFNGVEISVTLPADNRITNTMVFLADTANLRQSEVTSDFRQGVNNGKAVFNMVPDGSYRATVRCYDRRMCLYAASVLVTVKGDTKASIVVPDNVGTINVEVLAAPALGEAAMWRASWCAVSLWRADGTEVELPDPQFARCEAGQTARLICVPVGTYTVKVIGHGLLPAKQDNVTVTKGGDVSITLSPAQAGVVELSLSGVEIKNMPSVTAEDENGKVVKLDIPSEVFITLTQPHDSAASILVAHSLPAAVKQLRLKSPDFKEVVVKVSVEPGRTVLHAVKLTKE